MFFTLQRIRLNSGGYDRYGTYWGHGQPLYEFEGADDKGCLNAVMGACRAPNREAAKEHVRKHYPHAKFFR